MAYERSELPEQTLFTHTYRKLVVFFIHALSCFYSAYDLVYT